MNIKAFSKSGFSAALTIAICSAAQSVSAAGLTISQEPLFLTEGVAPNLLVTLDDSGSMAWGYAPDGISGDARTNNNASQARFFSSTYNPMYYNPSAVYEIPKTVTFNSATGLTTVGSHATPSFTSAPLDGFNPSLGTRVNLSNNFRATTVYTPGDTSQTLASHPFLVSGRYDNGTAAYYYVYDGSLCNNGAITNNACYRRVNVGASEQQNFANWYAFYRTRSLATASAANLAFYTLPENVRVTWQMLNSCTDIGNLTSTACRGISNTSYNNALRNFAGSHRQTFFSWLADIRGSGGTPLRGAARRAGEFLKNTGVNGPFAAEPGVTTAPQYACRPSYHILMTDGVWNGDSGFNVGNVDNTSIAALPDGTAYTPRAPFRDSVSNTVADVAFKYWAEDAQPNIANELKPYIPYKNANATTEYWDARNNPATWQHLVTYTLGLGLTRSLSNPAWAGSTFAGGYENLAAGTTAWPNAGSDSANNVYDLWHAAVNSRGEFFSVDSPEDMVTAFKTILSRIADRDTSASAVSLESAVTSAGNEAYYARFSSDNWSGELIKYDVDSNGALTLDWNARSKLQAQSPGTRNIKINRNSSLADFTWNNLSAAQQDVLNRNVNGVVDSLGSLRVNFLRGDRSRENTTFRERTYLLGDIIHSSPVVVGAPDRLAYLMDQAAGTSGNTSYANFRIANAERPKRIYVGANDGMLHGFDQNGNEVFAYIPTAVIPKLNRLTDKSYGTTHEFYVDGTPVTGDVFINGAWRTILVGTLRGGGRSVFALDITVPTDVRLLWEFSSTDDTDLGFSFPEPIITKLHNGKWSVILSNGYNSTNDRAALFILDAADGSVSKKITVGADNVINGLSTPRAVDINGDLVTDYVYAGDLQGNLWRFDLFDASRSEPFVVNPAAPVSANTFRAAFGARPLFSATNTNRQPITAAPTIVRHPTGLGHIVSVGTGKYIETTDAQANTSQAMTIYGIWDRQTAGENATTTPSITRNQLVQQSMETAITATFEDTDSNTSSSREIRLISQNPVVWYVNGNPAEGVSKYGWFLDLKEGSTLKGEMVVTDMSARSNVLFAATTTPNADPCSSGIDRWFMAIDAYTGGATQFNVLDLSGNNYVTAQDSYQGRTVSSVRIPGFGSPAIVGKDAFFNTSDSIQRERLDFGPASRGRQNWRILGE